MNSLENQLEIVREYARKQGFQIFGESYDDNVSGMRFDRKGLNQETQAVDAGKIDAVIVKALSQLWQNQLQTALFIRLPAAMRCGCDFCHGGIEHRG